MMSSRLDPEFQLNVEYGKLPWKDNPSIILLMSQDIHGDKKWKPVGTAFPVFHNGITLITAAHVVKSLSGKPVKAVSDQCDISLEGSQTKFHLGLDIAIIQCNSEVLNKLFNPCRCIEPEEKYGASDSAITSIYQVSGYPSSKNKYSRNEKFIPYAFKLSLGIAKQSPKSSELTKLNIPLLHFELDTNSLMDDKYQKTNKLSRFEGFSGGPVICTSELTRLGSLVGMFLEWDNQSKTATVLPWFVISEYITAHE